MISAWRVFTDGGSRGNPGKAASAAVVYDPAGKLRLICGKYLGIATNNIAEYTAVEIALQDLAKELGEAVSATNLNFYTDSNLLANQLSGKFKVKNPAIAEKIRLIKQLQSKFAAVTYNHIPREQNTEADREVNKILDSQN